MVGKLEGRYVSIKLADGEIISGHVDSEANGGVWLTVASNTGPKGRQESPQLSFIYVAFCQMIWMATTSSLKQR